LPAELQQADVYILCQRTNRNLLQFFCLGIIGTLELGNFSVELQL